MIKNFKLQNEGIQQQHEKDDVRYYSTWITCFSAFAQTKCLFKTLTVRVELHDRQAPLMKDANVERKR